MSEKPPSGPPPAQNASGFPAAPAPTGFPAGPAGSPSWPSAPPVAPRGHSRWPTFVALAIALIATGLAVVGWFRPAPPTPPRAAAPTYTEQQISDAKARACSAFGLVQKGVRLQTGASSPAAESSNDPAMVEAQAANARLSMIAGASYLRDHVDPATPPQIAAAIQHLSDGMSDLGSSYLAGAKNDDPEVVTLRNDGSSTAARLEELCK
jgi:hypothetical protein